MSTTPKSIFLALASFLLASCGGGGSTAAEPSRGPGGGSIAGTVGTENMGAARRLSGSKPSAEGVTVYLWDAKLVRAPQDSTRTDAQGRFAFANLPSGQWVVSVAQPQWGAISGRLALEGSAQKTQNLSLDRWIVGWVAIDTSAGAPTRAHILGIPGGLATKPGFVQVKSLPGQKVELVLGSESQEWSRQDILPVDGVPTVVGVATSTNTDVKSWVLATDPFVGWDFNGATPLTAFTSLKPVLSGNPSLRAVDAYQAIRFEPIAMVSVDSLVGLDSTYRLGVFAKMWLDSLPAETDSGLAVIADIGSRNLEVAIQSDGRLRLAAWRGQPARLCVVRSQTSYRMATRGWVDVASSLDRASGFSLWMNGQKIPLDAPSVDSGAFFPRPSETTRLTLGSSAIQPNSLPGALREFRLYRSAPYVLK
ncbi:MAG: hypothetical protein IPN71_08595 [Fibrobacteres bacterium]|nr:hypothetical protein [Fibrobacterota bacterium]